MYLGIRNSETESSKMLGKIQQKVKFAPNPSISKLHGFEETTNRVKFHMK